MSPERTCAYCGGRLKPASTCHFDFNGLVLTRHVNCRGGYLRSAAGVGPLQPIALSSIASTVAQRRRDFRPTGSFPDFGAEE